MRCWVIRIIPLKVRQRCNVTKLLCSPKAQGRPSDPMSKIEDLVTHPKTALRLAPHPHRPVKPGHQLLDVPTRHFSSFRSPRLICRFYIEELYPHKNQPTTYLMERVLHCSMDPCLLRREHAKRNVRRLRRGAAQLDRCCPTQVGRCGQSLWDACCCDIWREHDEQLLACCGSPLECIRERRRIRREQETQILETTGVTLRDDSHDAAPVDAAPLVLLTCEHCLQFGTYSVGV